MDDANRRAPAIAVCNRRRVCRRACRPFQGDRMIDGMFRCVHSPWIVGIGAVSFGIRILANHQTMRRIGHRRCLGKRCQLNLLGDVLSPSLAHSTVA
jgi:hypothetical protein